MARGGTRALAITDHDTFAGQGAATARAAELGVTIVPGVEMSLEIGAREIHVLAYFVGAAATELDAALARARAARRGHLPAMLARLAELGHLLDEAEVMAEVTPAEGGTLPSVGRPHVARALVKKGRFSSVEEVFDRLLGDGKPGRVRRALPDAAAMIGAARRAGGVCSVAHPSVSGVEPRDLETLRDAGLAAVEVYHPSHSTEDVIHYLRECDRIGLVATGGSDYHGGEYASDGPGLDRDGFEKLAAKRG